MDQPGRVEYDGMGMFRDDRWILKWQEEEGVGDQI